MSDNNPIELTEIIEVDNKLVEYNSVEAGLASLRAKIASEVYDITTTQGNAAARALRLLCVDTRSQVKKIYEEINAPLLERQRKAREIAKYITTEVELLEAPIDAAIKAEEARKAAEKKRLADIEAERVATIRAKIAVLAGRPAQFAASDAAKLQQVIGMLQSAPPTEGLFAELLPEAEQAQTLAIQQLNDLLIAASVRAAEEDRRIEAAAQVERERVAAVEAAAAAQAEADALRAQMAEMQRQAEQAKTAAADRERQEAEALAKRDAATRANHAKFLKEQQDAFELEHAAAKALLEAEKADVAAQRREIAAAIEAAKPKVVEQKPAPAHEFIAPAAIEVIAPVVNEPGLEQSIESLQRPSDAEIVRVLANTYGVSAATVVEWLSDMDLLDSDLSGEAS